MVPMRDIRAFVRRIVAEFKPRRVILFGSYAYGTPTVDSDVDLLVVFSGRGTAVDRSLDIRLRIPRPFALDLLTRTSEELDRRLAMNDWFMREVVEKGRVLYDSRNARMGRKSGRRPRGRRSRISGEKVTQL
jgi:predicted nucleotidyltransferase